MKGGKFFPGFGHLQKMPPMLRLRRELCETPALLCTLSVVIVRHTKISWDPNQILHADSSATDSGKVATMQLIRFDPSRANRCQVALKRRGAADRGEYR